MKHVLLSLGGIFLVTALIGQTGSVLDFVKISQTSGNFEGQLPHQGQFGYVSAASSTEVISGAPFAGNGEIHLIGLAADGSVGSQALIKASDYALFEDASTAEFGASSVQPGDLNGDGHDDYLVGAPGFGESGALVLLMSKPEGYTADTLSLPSELQLPGDRWGDHLFFKNNRYYAGLQSGTGSIVEFTISNEGQFELQHIFGHNHPLLSAHLDADDRFGTGIYIADLNGDGIDDIVCGAPGDDDGGQNFGAVYQLYLNAEGEIDQVVKLSRAAGGFTGLLNPNNGFGTSIVSLGDLDQDGNTDIAVSAPFTDDGLIDSGAIWIIFLREDGTMKRHVRISLLNGNFHFSGLAGDDRFGTRIAAIGDLNGDGTLDLIAGAPRKSDDGSRRGAFYTLFIEYCVVPTAVFSYQNIGGSVHFSIPGGEGMTYIWNFGDGGYSQQQNPVHTFTSGGTKTVCLTINGPCGGNFYCGPVQVNLSSLNTTQKDVPGLQVYPNPAVDLLHVESPLPLQSLSLIDLTGTAVWRSENIVKGTRIPVGQLAKGMYILRVYTESGLETARKVQVH